MNLLSIIKLLFQAVCNPDDFRDVEKCRDFTRNAVKIARAISEKNTAEWDEKVLDQLDAIIASDEIWTYCYNLVSGWVAGKDDSNVDPDPDPHKDDDPIFTPEGVAGISTVIPILITIYKFVRLLQRLNVEGGSNASK